MLKISYIAEFYSGFLVPHILQKLDVIPVLPQPGQVHDAGCGAGAGVGATGAGAGAGATGAA